MTTNLTPPAPWGTAQPGMQEPGMQQQMDPRAAAAAAKAYAKATRPWYKKKRFIIPIAVVVLMAIGGMSGGGEGDANSTTSATVESDASGATASGNEEKAASTTKPGKAKKAKTGSKNNPVRVGQTISLEGTKYTVKNARKSPTVGGEFMQEQADGVFVIVTLTIENTKDETKTFSDSAAKFVTKDDNSYSTNSEGTIAVMGTNEEPLWLADMQPDLPKTGKLVFDVPPAKVKGGSLEVSDLFGGGEAYIALGLR
jgi:hypothetical protein